MFLTRKQVLLRVFLFLIFIVLVGSIVALTFYCSNISALNVPKNYKGIFI